MTDGASITAEQHRLLQDNRREANWKRWGPYLAERQWGTVREDYSADGSCWTYLPHDHARSRAYRWGEDGLLGICDRECRLCFSLALWNGKDPILKERLFGLTGPEGNHGEDVKEQYFYLDSTPTHSYMKALYKYPQKAFPYDWLVEENGRRGRDQPEFEITDTKIFDDNRYFDVFAEYAKAAPDDLLIKITVINRGPDAADIHLLPTLWLRNSWSWGCTHEGCETEGRIARSGLTGVAADHPTLGSYRLEVDPAAGDTTWLFTNNETNLSRIFGSENRTPYVKDAFHTYLIGRDPGAVNPASIGTKAAAYYLLHVAPGAAVTLRLRLFPSDAAPKQMFGPDFDQIFSRRIAEANEFYDRRISPQLNAQQRLVARQAYAGLLWSKQFYHFVVREWLTGDPNHPPPPPHRINGRDRDWQHLFNRDVISMPDKWEYPWYAAWDLAFHTICFAAVDIEFAKEQLILLLREWYMHPNGQLPAYEFEFSDVNPPVHAWACWRVYKMSGPRGQRDRLFLERAFQKLIINFTWWVNRKDVNGRNIFGGGFLGLDNIGVFDRSKPLPDGGTLDQADGTAWMASFCGTMLAIALELASEDAAYEDVASKFFEHYIAISDAMNTLGGKGLWDETDGFYYDQLCANGQTTPLKIRSMVGLIPLIAVEVLEESVIAKLPGFRKRMQWFLKNRKDLSKQISYMTAETDPARPGHTAHTHYLLAIPSKERLQRVMKYMLDESEMLSPHGIRSLSRYHKDHPFRQMLGGQCYEVEYCPAESRSSLFGGNSNWRGPVWFPVNFLLIEALERYHHFYGDSFTVECPTGSGRHMTLQQVSRELSQRMCNLFLPGKDGQRPCHGTDRRFADDPNWKDLALFYEYFDGDTGRGTGASHQTGWTALAGRLILGEGRRLEHAGISTGTTIVTRASTHPTTAAAPAR